MSFSEPVSFAIKQLLAQSFIQKESQFIVALSGGVDSLCLLDALAKQVATSQIKAVYIDHQLQAESADWAQMNRDFCEKRGIGFINQSVEVDGSQASLEQAARKARYQALEQFIEPNNLLLTGHHQDDQAETLLLQLFRGSGSKGLSAMPEVADFGQGKLVRPLLGVSRQAIEAYAKLNNLVAIQDPTNQDSNIRRNFVRHQLIPLVETKWSAAKSVLARAAKIQADNQELLNDLAKLDWQECKPNSDHDCLSLSQLKNLSNKRQTNLLRYWLRRSNELMPSQDFLSEIQAQLLNARDDAQPLLQLQEHSMRRYRDWIYLVKDSSLVVPEVKEWAWQVTQDFVLEGKKRICGQEFKALYPDYANKELKITLRKEGVRFTPQGKSHSVSLKKYLQASGVPPWLREQTLLVWEQEQLIAVYLP